VKGGGNMIKTIYIDGKFINFKGDSNIIPLYKAMLKRNFVKDFKEIRKVVKYNIDPRTSPIKDLKKIDFNKLFLICWVFAKNADKTIPNPKEWEKEFKTFSVLYVIAELSEMIQHSLTNDRGVLYG
jgi:hypothetical protein